MKRIFLLLVLFFSLSFAEVKHFLNLDISTSCPGDILHAYAIGSDGEPGVDIRLRLVLYEPYQGLRAVMYTDETGYASTELTKAGKYRIYIRTYDYNHNDTIDFEYPELCPPPPPKQMELEVQPDCTSHMLNINVKSDGSPLSGVLISAGDWSSFTGSQGLVSFPFEDGTILITVNKSGYAPMEIFKTISCVPPECGEDAECASNQYCWNGSCINITGKCGYVFNHTWMAFECCSDDDCTNATLCINNACVVQENESSVPEQNISEYVRANESAVREETEQPPAQNTLIVYIAGAVVIALAAFFAIKHISKTEGPKS